LLFVTIYKEKRIYICFVDLVLEDDNINKTFGDKEVKKIKKL
jgi:hypothetical protein